MSEEPKKGRSIFRFGLKSLLLFITLAAIGAGVARLYLGQRAITALDAQTVEVGHSEWQVRYLLGPPHRIYHYNDTWWEYDFQSKTHWFEIVFRDGRVISTKRRRPFFKLPASS
jgi:hypothetical protein